MGLDTRSLVIASVLVAGLLGAIVLYFARRQPGARALNLWGAAALVLAAGLAALALRGMIPDFLSIVVANTLVIVATTLAYRSLLAFRNRHAADPLGWLLVAAAFAGLILLSEVWPDLRARIVMLSALLAFLLARGALVLHGNVAPDCRVSFGFTRVTLWAAAAAMLVRAIAVASQSSAEFMAPNLVHAGTFLGFMAVITAATLGVLWMQIQVLHGDLTRLATQDSLTGTLNRRAFLAEFEREASRSARHPGVFSLAIFDLDRFKAVNDRHGHPAGDQVLRTVADTLRATTRKHDVLGRYGGEEFALLMPSTDKVIAALVAERIRLAVEEKGVPMGAGEVRITLSGGLATSGVDGEDWDTLLNAADNALYVAKKSGRNRIVNAGTDHAGAVNPGAPAERMTGTA